jgi:uncharacterized metal-binding protein YceD (DUF177 family)
MNAPIPEFSRVVSVTRISPKGIEEILGAKPAERAALAKRFDLIEITMLKAALNLTPGAQQTIIATGNIKAEVIQRCIVTLEPITNRLELDVNVVFIPEESNQAAAKVSEEAELEDEFELFSGGKIDIGEMVAQHIGINIDLYPRKADATLDVTKFGINLEKPGPFAKLAKVVKSKKNKDKR